MKKLIRFIIASLVLACISSGALAAISMSKSSSSSSRSYSSVSSSRSYSSSPRPRPVVVRSMPVKRYYSAPQHVIVHQPVIVRHVVHQSVRTNYVTQYVYRDYDSYHGCISDQMKRSYRFRLRAYRFPMTSPYTHRVVWCRSPRVDFYH